MNTEIVLSKTKYLTEDLRYSESRIKVQRLALQDVCVSLRSIQSDAMHEVRMTLNRQIEGLLREEQKIKMLRATLKKINSLYENCEEKILSLEEELAYQVEFGRFDTRPYLRILDELDVHFRMQPLMGGKE